MVRIIRKKSSEWPEVFENNKDTRRYCATPALNGLAPGLAVDLIATTICAYLQAKKGKHGFVCNDLVSVGIDLIVDPSVAAITTRACLEQSFSLWDNTCRYQQGMHQCYNGKIARNYNSGKWLFQDNDLLVKALDESPCPETTGTDTSKVAVLSSTFLYDNFNICFSTRGPGGITFGVNLAFLLVVELAFPSIFCNVVFDNPELCLDVTGIVTGYIAAASSYGSMVGILTDSNLNCDLDFYFAC